MSGSIYLSVGDAAVELGISAEAVNDLIDGEKLPAIRRSEHGTIIPRHALDAYLRKDSGRAPHPGGRVHYHAKLRG